MGAYFASYSNPTCEDALIATFSCSYGEALTLFECLKATEENRISKYTIQEIKAAIRKIKTKKMQARLDFGKDFEFFLQKTLMEMMLNKQKEVYIYHD